MASPFNRRTEGGGRGGGETSLSLSSAAVVGKMMSPSKCVECLLHEEQSRQWGKERAELLAIIRRMQTQQRQDQHQQGNTNVTSTTAAGDLPNTTVDSPLGLTDPASSISRIHRVESESEISPAPLQRRVSRRGSFRKLVTDAATDTDDELLLPLLEALRPPPTPEAEEEEEEEADDPQQVVRSAVEELYEAEKEKSAVLQQEVERLQIVLRSSELRLRDSLNANQREFLLKHTSQIDEERNYENNKKVWATLKRYNGGVGGAGAAGDGVGGGGAAPPTSGATTVNLTTAQRIEATATLQRKDAPPRRPPSSSKNANTNTNTATAGTSTAPSAPSSSHLPSRTLLLAPSSSSSNPTTTTTSRTAGGAAATRVCVVCLQEVAREEYDRHRRDRCEGASKRRVV